MLATVNFQTMFT